MTEVWEGRLWRLAAGVFLALVAGGIAVFCDWYMKRPEPGVKKVWVVGPPEQEANYQHWKPVVAYLGQFKASSTGRRLEERIKFELMPTFNGGSQLAQEACDDPNVVALIGFVSTAVASEALRVLDKCLDPVPVLLVGATGDELTENNDHGSFQRAVLQMAPSNRSQAELIATALLIDTYRAGEQMNLLIVRDYKNTSIPYADDLAEQIHLAMSELPGAEVNLVDGRDYEYRELDKISFQSLLDRYTPPPDVVIFAGMAERAASLLAKRDPADETLVIVTDGSVTPLLLSEPGAVCIWGTYPSYPNHESAQTGHERAPSFVFFARIALNLIAGRLTQGSESNAISRKSITKEMEHIVFSNRKHELPEETHIRFDWRGRVESLGNGKYFNNTTNLYHTMQIISESGTTRWSHREKRTSLHGCRTRDANAP